MQPFKQCIGILLVLMMVWSASSAEEITSAGAPFQSLDQETFLQEQMADLRILHEGTVFLLKRYATCEALISALDQGRTENQAYGIGAASLVPGAGQMINEDYLQGGLLMFSSAISFGSIRQLAFTRQTQTGSEGLLPAYYATLILRNGLMTYAMLHATQKQYVRNEDRTTAMWCGMASMVPGVGQAVNQDWWEAGGFFIAWAASTLLTTHFEEQIFISGNDGYLVKKEEPLTVSVAWLPGGGKLGLSYQW